MAPCATIDGVPRYQGGSIRMSSLKIEALTWVLIYAGLAAFTLGWFVEVRSAAVGSLLMIGGGTSVAVGVVLIFVRARRSETR